MDKRRLQAQPRSAQRGMRRWWPVVAVGAVAVAAVIWLISLAQAEPGRPATAVPAQGKTKGNANAPVLVEEWGDYQ